MDIVEIVKCGRNNLEVYEGFFCQTMQNSPYIEFVNDMVAKRNRYKKQGKDLLQTLFIRISTQYMEVTSDGMLTTNVSVLQIVG